MAAKIKSLRESETVKVVPEDFEMLKIIGGSESSQVVLARKKENRQYYALKIIEKKEIAEEGELLPLLTEKQVLQNDSPFLVHLHDAFQTPTHLFLAMDFIGGGDLATHLKRENRFNETKTRFVVAELVLSLEYLHSRGVVYR